MHKSSLASILPRFQELLEAEEMWTLLSWWCELSVPHLKLMKGEVLLAEADVKELLSVARRRARGISLTYALGWRPFYGRRFLVSPAVLVPRQETEELVDHILGLREIGRLGSEAVEDTFLESQPLEKRHLENVLPVLVDCGTGSGCIPITLSLEEKWHAVYAWDVSEGALEVARANATSLGAKEVEFLHGDIRSDTWGEWLHGVLRNLEDGQSCLLAGNLPYIPTDEMISLDADVQQEPTLALDGGLHGTAIMKPWLLQIQAAADQTKIKGRVTAHLEGDPDNVEDLTAWCGAQGMGISWREDALGQLRFCDITFAAKLHG